MKSQVRACRPFTLRASSYAMQILQLQIRMEKHDIKLLLVLALHHLVLALQHLVRLVQSGIRLVQYYADIVARSPLVLKLTAWMERFAQRPWFRKCRHALYHCVAFVVGSTYEDERVAFTARKLVKNDAYRDRLLVPEIEDLVALCDALRLALPQRKAYFQCFMHIDFMRRSNVSRAELLRYCSLRSTPLTSFLLPNGQGATHRETARNRWDIMQLMAASFSLCTADILELVRLAVTEAISPRESEADESDNEESVREEVVGKKEVVEQNEAGAVEDGKQVIHGVSDPGERSLQALLVALYDEGHIEQNSGEIISPRITFQEIHGVDTIYGVVRLFPVLIFPCIWTQRVLRTRILGVKTWQCLQQRRMQLQPHLPTGSLFLSVADIVAASQVQLQQKLNREDQILTPTSEQQDVDSALSIALLSSRSDESAGSKKSTPRKVIPCSGSEPTKSGTEATSYTLEEPSNLRLTFDQCSTSEEAWRVSANHALASVYIQCLLGDSTATSEGLKAEFEQVTKQIFAGELSAEKSEQIRQRLVKVYGYRFAHSLLAKSNVKELNHASKTPLDERRAKQRYAKAWRDSSLVEDKLIYWKEFEDPVAKRAFYYNIRTGESRWKKPVNFVGKKKVRKRRKVENAIAQLQPKP